MPARSVKLTAAQQQKVLTFIKNRMQGFNIISRRDRYITINKALQLESDIRRQKDKDQRLDFFEDIQIGTIAPAIDTIQGFFTDLYLSSTPTFPVLSTTKESLDAVGQFNAVMEQEERDFCWARQLTLWFRAASKYNVGALECAWTNRTTEIVNASSNSVGSEAAIATTAITGNNLQAWDMYNTFYDTSVAIPDISTKGEFAARAEALSMISLAKLIDEIRYEEGIILNEKDIWGCYTSTVGMDYYETPYITPDKDLKDGSNGGWQGHFDDAWGLASSTDKKRRPSGVDSRYELVTFYARIIPAMFGIKGPGDTRVQVWKFLMVGNKHIIYAEHQNNVHGLIPVVFAQPREDDIGEQIKSTAEILVPLQNLSTQLYDARLAGLARSVNDRLVYAGGVIDEKDVLSQSPISRIKMRPNALYKDVRQALMSLPYTDNIGSTFLNELNYIKQQGQDLTRLNRPQQGQFQKGNKTLGEFNTVMQNAQMELRTMGILFENQAITPLKQIILSNVLQYKPSLTVVDSQNATEVRFNPAQVRKAHLHFKLADGLRTPEDEMDIQLVREFYQYSQIDPSFQQRYDMVAITSYIFENSGLNIKQFEYSAKNPPPAPVTPAVAPTVPTTPTQ